MDPRLAQIVDRIKKLMAKARGNPSQAEADTAVAIAARLMREHAISEAEIEQQSGNARNESDWITWSSTYFARLYTEQRLVCELLVAHFGVRVVLRQKRTAESRQRETQIQIFGRPEQVAIAEYVLEYLVREFRRRFRLATSRPRATPARPAFRAEYGRPTRSSWMRGCAAGVASRLEEAKAAAETKRETQWGIVVANQLAAAYDRHFGDLPKAKFSLPSEMDQNVAWTGYLAGREIAIRTPIRGPQPARIE